MKVDDLVRKLHLTLFSGESGLNTEVSGCYVSDLLSNVLCHTEAGMAWATVQTHQNVAAVAFLKDLACVILVEGQKPAPDMLLQAKEKNIVVLGSADDAYELSGKLFALLGPNPKNQSQRQ